MAQKRHGLLYFKRRKSSMHLSTDFLIDLLRNPWSISVSLLQEIRLTQIYFGINDCHCNEISQKKRLRHLKRAVAILLEFMLSRNLSIFQKICQNLLKFVSYWVRHLWQFQIRDSKRQTNKYNDIFLYHMPTKMEYE